MQWYAAELPDDDEHFARLAGALAPSFHIITPGGRIIARPTLLEALRQAHGSHADTANGFDIDIRDVQLRFEQDGLTLATYEEWQQAGDNPSRGRLSTVLFAHDAAAPNGLRWLHVHETWL